MSLLSGLAFFCFFHFFFLFAPSRGCCTQVALLPEKRDLWRTLLPLHTCLCPRGKSSGSPWISTPFQCFPSWGFFAHDAFIFFCCSLFLLCFPCCSFQSLLFFLWMGTSSCSSGSGVSDCSGRRPASCRSGKQSRLFQCLKNLKPGAW